MNLVLYFKLIFIIGIIVFLFKHFKVKYEFIIIIVCISVIFIVKKKSVSTNLKDSFKNNLIRKISFSINNNNFFIMKKSIANKKIKVLKGNNVMYDNNDILHYPSFQSNLLDVGDIILSTSKDLFSGLIRYFTSSDINHVAAINSFIIDNKNEWKHKKLGVNNFEIPDDYYLVIPTLIQGAVYPIFKDIDIYNFLILKYTKLNIFRYKYGDDSLRKEFGELTKYLAINSDYDFDFFAEFFLFRIFKFIFDIFSKIIDLGFYNNNKLFYSFYTSLILSNVDSKKINILSELVYDIYNNYMELEGTNDKKLVKKIKKQIEKKSALLSNNSKNLRGFVCSSIIYFIYYKFGVDLFNNKSFGTDPVKYSYTVTPADYLKIINDNRFDYICTITGYN